MNGALHQGDPRFRIVWRLISLLCVREIVDDANELLNAVHERLVIMVSRVLALIRNVNADCDDAVDEAAPVLQLHCLIDCGVGPMDDN